MIAKKLLNNIQKRGIYQVNQNNYVGQSPVEIANDTIYLEANFVNKVNSIDNLQQDIRQNTNSITTNTSSINTINNSINGISTQLTTLNNSINTTNNNVSTNTQNITNNTNNITANRQNIATNTSSIEANRQEIEAVKTKAETNENNISTINTTLTNKLDTATFNQEKANFAKLNQANTFTQQTNFNNAIVVNSGSNDFTWETSRNWNQNIDNTIVRTKDLKWVRIFEYTSGVHQPTTNWNRDTWKWTLTNLNSNSGVYEVLLILSYQDDVAATLRADIVWKSGLVESRSQIVSIEKNDTTFYFQFVIKNDSRLYIYMKKDNAGSGANISWVRGWIKRGITFPTKANSLW